MRKLLLFFAMLLMAIVVNAKPINWTYGTYIVTGGDADGQKQTLTVSGPGAFAAFVAATKDLPGGPPAENEPLLDLGKEPNRSNLVITGELNADDLAALNSAVSGCGNLATFKTLDLSGATFSIGDVSGMNLGGLEYLRLPDGMTSADDVVKMGILKNDGNNANLKVVGAYDGSDSVLPELALYSFAENEVSNFSSQMMNVADLAMVARLAGTYGDKDLANNGPVFGWTPPCIWDFTGATFTTCTVNPGIEVDYYAYNDPFCGGGTSKPGGNYQTNAFFYFSTYSKQVADIKLPTGITELPPRTLSFLGHQNTEKSVHKAAYKAYYDFTDAEMEKNAVSTSCAIIPDLIIPENYVTLDYECGNSSHIQHLVVGKGVKVVEGGAFSYCIDLEDLDFAAGLRDCYLGDRAFAGDAESKMKHIALSEGIVSLGNYCFQNAQHLESIRLPQSLIDIGNYAFDNCLALNSITIPENVDKIGMNAFRLCPFTDIYLTTTDPDKIPIVFTGGNSFNGWGAGASFHHGHYDGWEALSGIHPGNEPDGMTWDEAVEWYFIHANGLPVLHYPKELAGKVRADISANYHSHSSDTPALGLPTSLDMHARETAGGADVGTPGQGIYTRDGWAQFMLMKESTTDPGGDVYTKKYEDVWYTMCFPFDLTDEQLAAAFNETFNIVDFSGVEIKEEDETTGTPKKLVLHFNKVAKTYYRDSAGNEYEVIGRETDPTSKFDYNIYRRNGVEYHHSQVSSQLSSNKTKTFAPGNSISDSNANKDNAIIIDGVLATAGHPYMIHPAIGTSIGDPKRCDFSGITWKPMTQWATIFENQKREVDLGVAKGTINEEDFKKSTPDEDNYTQAAYTKYAGQTYTFIGNANVYNDNCPPEPYVGNGLAPLPSVTEYTDLYPNGPAEPVAPTEPDEQEVINAVGVRMTTADEPVEPTQGANPADDTTTYPTELQEFYNTTFDNGKVLGEEILNWSFSNIAGGPHNWGYVVYQLNINYEEAKAAFKAYFDPNNTCNNIGAIETTLFDEAKFNTLKGKCQDFYDALIPYNNFDAIHTAWEIDHQAWQDNIDAWNNYDTDLANYNSYDSDAAWDAYRTAKQEYEDAVAEWEEDCADIEEENERIHSAWVQTAMSFQRLIPTGAYFLGRRGLNLPKYYREIADDTRTDATGGFWTQFTAVVIPNDAAKSGIENELDGKTASSKGFDMAFDEGFLGEFIEQDDVVTLIEKAKEEGAKVEYLDIVVSINGEVVRRGTTSIEGLPKGIYIVNGKKYFVK